MGNSVVSASDADDEWLKRSCASFYEDELFDLIASSSFTYLDNQKYNDVIPNENRMMKKRDIYDVYQFVHSLDGVANNETDHLAMKSDQLLTLKLIDCIDLFCKQGIISQHYIDYNRDHAVGDIEGNLLADDTNIYIDKTKSGMTPHTTGLCSVNDDLIRIFLRYRHNLNKTFAKSDQIYAINERVITGSNKIAIFKLRKRFRRRAIIRLYDAIARNEKNIFQKNKGINGAIAAGDTKNKISIAEFLSTMMHIGSDNEIITSITTPSTEEILMATSLTTSTSLLNCDRDCILFNYYNNRIDENKLMAYDNQVRSLCTFLIDLYRASMQQSLSLRSNQNIDGSINISTLLESVGSPVVTKCGNICTWDTSLSDNSIDFSEDNTMISRRNSNSAGVTAYNVISTNFSSVTYFIADTVTGNSVSTIVMSMGLCRRGVSSGSAGFGLSANSWGIVDDRSSINSTNIYSNNTKLTTFRRLKVGDVITLKCNLAEEWLEIYVNVNELYHRINLSLDTKLPSDFYFGVIMNSNNVKVKVLNYSIEDLNSYLSIGPGATTSSSTTIPSIAASPNVSNVNLCCDQGHSLTKHVGLPDTYVRRYQSSSGVVVSCNVCSRAYIHKDKLHFYHCAVCSFDLCWNCSIDRLQVPVTSKSKSFKSKQSVCIYKCVSPMTAPLIDTTSKTMLCASLQQLCLLLKEDICLYPVLAPPSTHIQSASINRIKTQYMGQLNEMNLNTIFLNELRSANTTTHSTPSDDGARYDLCLTFLMVIAIYKHSLTDLLEIVLYLLQSPIPSVELKILPSSKYSVEYLLTKGLYISTEVDSDSTSLYYQDDKVSHIEYLNSTLDCFFNNTYQRDIVAENSTSEAWKYDSSVTLSQKQGLFLLMALYNMTSVQVKYSEGRNNHIGFDITSDKVLHALIKLIENAAIELAKSHLNQSTANTMVVDLGGYALGILHYACKKISIRQSNTLLSYRDETYSPQHDTEIINVMNKLQDSRHLNGSVDQRLRREEMNLATQNGSVKSDESDSYRLRIKQLLNLIIINPCVDPASVIGKYAILSAGTRDLFITTPSEQFERISLLLAAAQDSEDTPCERALCMQLMSELEGPKILRLLKPLSGDNNLDRSFEECDQFLSSMMRIADRALRSKLSSSHQTALNDANDGKKLQEQVLRVLEPIVLQTTSSLCQDILVGVGSASVTTKVPLARLLNITNELLSSTSNNINIFINTINELLDNYAYADKVLGMSHVGCLIPLCLFTITVFIEELIRGGGNIYKIADANESSNGTSCIPFITLSKSLNELIKLIHRALTLKASIFSNVNQVSPSSTNVVSKNSPVKSMPIPEEITKWDLSTSNSSLEFTEDYSCCKRPGSVSCYPAAFAPLHKTYSAFTVVIDEAGSRTNWLSIGICKVGFATSSSDGFGRTSHSWGIADDRSKESENAFFASGGTRVSVAPRKLKVGDIVSITVDLVVGYAIFSVNNGEFAYTFGKVEPRPDNNTTINQNVPKGDTREYWFGATFANDHKLRIAHSPLINAGLSSSVLPSESSIHWLERLHDEAIDLQSTILGQLFDKSIVTTTTAINATTDAASANTWLDSPLLAVGIIQGVSPADTADHSETLTPYSTIYSKTNKNEGSVSSITASIPNAFVSLTEEQQAQWDMLHQLTDAPLGLGLSQYLVAMMKRVVIRDRGSEAGPNHIVHAAIAAMIWHEGYGPEAYQIAISGEKGVVVKPSKGLEQIWIMGQYLRAFYPEEDSGAISKIDDLVDDVSLLTPIEMNRQHSLPPPQNGQGPLNLCTLAAVRRARLLLSFPPVKLVNSSQWSAYPHWESMVDFNNTYNKVSVTGKEVSIPDIILYFIRFGPDPDIVRDAAKERTVLCMDRNVSINFINIILKDNTGNVDFNLKILNVLNEAMAAMPGPSNHGDMHYLKGLYGGNSNNLYGMQVTWSSLMHTVTMLLSRYLDKLNEAFIDPAIAAKSDIDLYSRVVLAGLAVLAKDYGASSIQCIVDLYGLHSSGIATVLQKGVNCFNSSIRGMSFKLIDVLIHACSNILATANNCDHEMLLLNELNALITSYLKKAVNLYADDVSQSSDTSVEKNDCVWIKKGEVIIDPAEEGLSIIPRCSKALNRNTSNNSIQFWLWIPSVVEKETPVDDTSSSVLPLISVFSSESAEYCLTIQLIAGNQLTVNIGSNYASSGSNGSASARSSSGRGSPSSPLSPSRERSGPTGSAPSSPARANTANVSNILKSASALRYNKWIHVCVTFLGAEDKAYLYLDGMVVAATSVGNVNDLSLFHDNSGNLLPFHIGQVPGILKSSHGKYPSGITEPCILADVAYNNGGFQDQNQVINSILRGYNNDSVCFKKNDVGVAMHNSSNATAVGYISLPMVLTGNVFSMTLQIDTIPVGDFELKKLIIGILANAVDSSDQADIKTQFANCFQLISTTESCVVKFGPDTPMESDYRLQPGDVVSITVDLTDSNQNIVMATITISSGSTNSEGNSSIPREFRFNLVDSFEGKYTLPKQYKAYSFVVMLPSGYSVTLVSNYDQQKERYLDYNTNTGYQINCWDVGKSKLPPSVYCVSAANATTTGLQYNTNVVQVTKKDTIILLEMLPRLCKCFAIIRNKAASTLSDSSSCNLLTSFLLKSDILQMLLSLAFLSTSSMLRSSASIVLNEITPLVRIQEVFRCFLNLNLIVVNTQEQQITGSSFISSFVSLLGSLINTNPSSGVQATMNLNIPCYSRPRLATQLYQLLYAVGRSPYHHWRYVITHCIVNGLKQCQGDLNNTVAKNNDLLMGILAISGGWLPAFSLSSGVKVSHRGFQKNLLEQYVVIGYDMDNSCYGDRVLVAPLYPSDGCDSSIAAADGNENNHSAQFDSATVVRDLESVFSSFLINEQSECDTSVIDVTNSQVFDMLLLTLTNIMTIDSSNRVQSSPDSSLSLQDVNDASDRRAGSLCSLRLLKLMAMDIFVALFTTKKLAFSDIASSAGPRSVPISLLKNLFKTYVTSQFLSSIAALNTSITSKSAVVCNFCEVPTYSIDKVSCMWQQTVLNLNNGGGDDVVLPDDTNGVDMSLMYEHITTNASAILEGNTRDEKGFRAAQLNSVANDFKEFPALIMTALNHTSASPIYAPSDTSNISTILEDKSKDLKETKPNGTGSISFRLKCSASTTHCRIRVLPSLDSPEIGDVRNLTIVEICGCINGFYKLANVPGYVKVKVDGAIEWERVVDESKGSGGPDHVCLSTLSRNISDCLQYKLYSILCILVHSWPCDIPFPLQNESELLLFLKVCGLGRSNDSNTSNGVSITSKDSEKSPNSSLLTAFLKAISTKYSDINDKLYLSLVTIASKLVRRVHNRMAGQNTSVDLNNIIPVPPYPPVIVESLHDYENNSDTNVLVHLPGATSLELVFDSECSTERNYDYVAIYGDEARRNLLSSKYSGRRQSSDKNWPGVDGKPPLMLHGVDKIWISFISDGSNTDWGWKVSVHGIFGGDNYYNNDDFIVSKVLIGSANAVRDDDVTVAPINVYSQPYYVRECSIKPYLSLSLNIVDILLLNSGAIDCNVIYSSAEGLDLLRNLVASVGIVSNTHPSVLLLFFNICSKLFAMYMRHDQQDCHSVQANLHPLISILADCIIRAGSAAQAAYKSTVSSNNHRLTPKSLISSLLMQSLAQAVVMASSLPVKVVAPKLTLDPKSNSDDGLLIDLYSALGIFPDMEVCNGGLGLRVPDEMLSTASCGDITDEMIKERYADNIGLGPTFPYLATRAAINNVPETGNTVNTIYSHTNYVKLVDLKRANDYDFSVGVMFIPLVLFEDQVNLLKGRLGMLSNTVGVRFKSSHDGSANGIDCSDTYYVSAREVHVGDIISVTLRITSDMDVKSLAFSDENEIIDCMKASLFFQHNGVDIFAVNFDLKGNTDVDYNPGDAFNDKLLLYTAYSGMSSLNNIMSVGCNISHGVELLFMSGDDVPGVVARPTICNNVVIDNSRYSKYSSLTPKPRLADKEDCAPPKKNTDENCYVFTSWDVSISDSYLLFTENNSVAKRPGSVSCYPAALVKTTPAPVSTVTKTPHHVFSLTMTLAECPVGPNSMSIGLAYASSFQKSGSDGFGPNRNSWGIIESRSSGDGKIFSNQTSIGTFRKMVQGDVFSIKYDRMLGKAWLSINNGELLQEFDIHAPGEQVPLLLGGTFCNDHKLRIDNVPSITIPDASGSTRNAVSGGGSEGTVSTSPLACTTIMTLPTPPSVLLLPSVTANDVVDKVQIVKQWNIARSHTALSYSNESRTCSAVNVSLPHPNVATLVNVITNYTRCSFTAMLEELPTTSNVFSLGIALSDFSLTGGNIFGDRPDSWGVCSHRAGCASSQVSVKGEVLETFRALKATDTFHILIVKDHTNHSCSALLSIYGSDGDNFKYKFQNLPYDKDLVIGATLCDNQLLTIIDTSTMSYNPTPYASISEHLSESAQGVTCLDNSYSVMNERISNILRSKESVTKYLVQNHMIYRRNSAMKAKKSHELVEQRSILDILYMQSTRYISEHFFPVTITEQLNRQLASLPTYVQPLKNVYDIMGILLQRSGGDTARNSKEFDLPRNFIYDFGIPYCCIRQTKYVEMNPADNRDVEVAIPQAIGYIIDINSSSSCSSSTRITIYGRRSLSCIPKEEMSNDFNGEYTDELLDVAGLESIDADDSINCDRKIDEMKLLCAKYRAYCVDNASNPASILTVGDVVVRTGVACSQDSSVDDCPQGLGDVIDAKYDYASDDVTVTQSHIEVRWRQTGHIIPYTIGNDAAKNAVAVWSHGPNILTKKELRRRNIMTLPLTTSIKISVKDLVTHGSNRNESASISLRVTPIIPAKALLEHVDDAVYKDINSSLCNIYCGFFNVAAEKDSGRDSDATKVLSKPSHWSLCKADREINISLIKAIQANLHARNINDTQVLTKTWQELDPSSMDVVQYPVLYSIVKNSSIEVLRCRYELLQLWNNEIFKCLDLINLAEEEASKSSLYETICALYIKCKGFMFSCIKEVLVSASWSKSETISAPKFELIISRSRAQKFKEKGEIDVDGKWSVFGQIFSKLNSMPPSVLRKNGQIWDTVFAGERSQDAGGPYREAWSALCEDLMSNYVPLLHPSANNVNNVGMHREAYILNPDIPVHDSHQNRLNMFVFLGKLFGSAARSKNYLDVCLAPIVWKLLLHDPVDMDDLDHIDHSLVKWLKTLRSRKISSNNTGNRGTSSDGMQSLVNLTAENFHEYYPDMFYTVTSVGGKQVELHPGGGNELLVWGQSIDQYCDEVIEFKLMEMKVVCDAVRLGLATQLPPALLHSLTHEELEEMVCGKPDIDLVLLKSTTEYERGCAPTDQHIIWFWELLENEFKLQDKKAFLRFTWGRTKLPTSRQAFTQVLKIQGLHKTPADNYLPVTHTCFFSIELPRYTTKEILRDKLLYAIYNCVAIDGDDTTAGLRSASLGFE